MLRISSGLVDKLLGGANSDSFQGLLSGGVLRFYSGTQPSTADDSEGAGVLLAEISLSGATFSPGSPSTNGLTFDNPTSGELPKAAAESWQGTGVADGNAGWFRFYASTRETGSSTTAIRFDGVIASSGGELTMANNLIAVGTPVVINTFSVVLPKS